MRCAYSAELRITIKQPVMQTEQIKVELSVSGEPVTMAMTVPAEPVKLRRMLPLLRQMSDSFVGAAEEQIAAAGKVVSCKAGCGACCRQLVPVSEVEALELSRFVGSVEESRRTKVLKRFSDGMARLRDAGFFERLEAASETSEEAYQAVIREYFRFGIACPFLEDESCSIHEVRPITCREYLVTSPPELCRSSEGAGIDNVAQLFLLKDSLISISRRSTSETLPYVPLIAVMDWAAAQSDVTDERIGRDWIGAVFEQMMRFGRESVPEDAPSSLQ